MNVGWRSRARAEFLETVRVELATTRADLQAGLADGLASLETQLRDDHAHSDATAALSRTLVDARDGIGTNIRGLVDALDRLAHTNRDLSIAERDHYQVLLGALERIGSARHEPRSAQLQEPLAHGRVVGGTIDPAPTLGADELSGARRGDGSRRNAVLLDGVEVRCRFADNHWVGGFEVCDVFNDGGVLRDRLRRRSDGYLLPTLFDEASVRERG
jgi:hypothetical protein